MDGIIDAVVPGSPTAKHLRVGRVDGGVDSQRRDVATLQAQASVLRRGRCFFDCVNPYLVDKPLQQLVLLGEEAATDLDMRDLSALDEHDVGFRASMRNQGVTWDVSDIWSKADASYLLSNNQHVSMI